MTRSSIAPRALLTALISGLLMFVATAGAQAAAPPIVTNQAHAAKAAFLAYAPPPAGGAKAMCLIDSGVNAIPDTVPGLVSATALDGGTGVDVDPLWHGTNDAVIAGGAGYEHVGAWPQLKIVSIRATDIPQPGKQPTFQFDDYVRGIRACTLTAIEGVQVAAIALPLSSVIPPTPDQADAFRLAVGQAQAQGISILAAAGNDPGPIQLPGSQPGILPVGAGDTDNAICSFSATTGLTFYAPGCGIHKLDAQGHWKCCANGTSQASAFAAGVLVALRSYNTALTADQAVQLLLTTAHGGHLDVTALFEAAGLSEIVKAGKAAIPKRPKRPLARVTWRAGVLRATVRNMPAGAKLHIKMTFANRTRRITTSKPRVRIGTPPPKRVTLRYSITTATRTISGPSITLKVSRARARR